MIYDTCTINRKYFYQEAIIYLITLFFKVNCLILNKQNTHKKNAYYMKLNYVELKLTLVFHMLQVLTSL